MGQYYKPIILAEKTDLPVSHLYTWDYDTGMKLMEHSWLLNDMVGAFANQLIEKPQRVVWAGDYADIEKGTEGTGYKGKGKNLYALAIDETKVNPLSRPTKMNKYPFLVNHTKKEFVNMKKTPANKSDWRIHPLPLLTVEGNGRGGGDYRGNKGLKFLGTWSRDTISLEKTKPQDYKLIKPNFIEEW